jgi:hypothetical protein
LIGVGCLAAPVKFLAPGLKAGEALDVGRRTFAAFNKLEWLYAVVLLAICAEMERVAAAPGRCMQRASVRFHRIGTGDVCRGVFVSIGQ